ncbi:acyl carrier protein [Nocardia sp. NPDC058658]|uniref:acyl carrier protein n=1 Tax=Nocardia sp. NPDC058658 TaxID=3346580 RepID=UPI00364655E6
MDVVESKIVGYLADRRGWQPQTGVGRLDYPLLDNGVLDSLAIIGLVGFLEREFAITVTDTDMMPDNFETVRCIAGLVRAAQQVADR